MPDEKSTKDVVLAIYPEAHVHYDEDAECCILTDKTENAGYEHYDEDEDEEEEEDED